MTVGEAGDGTDAPPSSPGPRRRGLGRGLDALLGSASATAAGGVDLLVELDPAAIETNPEQPRVTFDPEALEALRASIATHGVLQPVVVEATLGGHRLIAGERRLRAAKLAGLASIPAIVRPAAESNRQALELALTENLVRADLSAIEEAGAYNRLADTFGLSHEAIALRVGRSRPAVSNAIRLLTLPAAVQLALGEGRISAGHARALLGLSDPAAQEAMAADAEARGLSVRQVERMVQAANARATPRAEPAPVEERADEPVRRGLEAALGTPVRISRRGDRGEVVIPFYNDDDLTALYDRLGGQPL